MIIKLPAQKLRLLLYFLIFVTLVSTRAGAQLKLPNVLGSNMILQRDMPVPIWGWAKQSSTVMVKFAGQTKSAIADTGGRWQVNLDALKANSIPQVLMIINDQTSLSLTNVLVGEVWLCSGQSNMEYRMKKPA